MTDCVNIHLEPHRPVYTQSDTVNGHLKLNLFQDAILSEVKVYFEGRAHVQWSEQVAKNKTETYTEDKVIFCYETLLVRGYEKLLFGSYKLPFTFSIPTAFPSSFESKYGWIRYFIRGVMKIKGRKKIESLANVTLNHLVNLRINPQAKIPLELGIVKKRSCWCFPFFCLCPCTVGKVEIRLKMNKAGYVPGENILINGFIQNKGKSDVKSIVIAIRQMRIYVAETKMKVSDKIVQKVTKPGLKAGEKTEWNDVAILVPAVIPSLKFIECIQTIYAVTVKAELPLCRSVKATSTDEFFIGSIPTEDAAKVQIQQPLGGKDLTMKNAESPYTCQGVIQTTVRKLNSKDFILNRNGSSSPRGLIPQEIIDREKSFDDSLYSENLNTQASCPSIIYGSCPDSEQTSSPPCQSPNHMGFDKLRSESSSSPAYHRTSSPYNQCTNMKAPGHYSPNFFQGNSPENQQSSGGHYHHHHHHCRSPHSEYSKAPEDYSTNYLEDETWENNQMYESDSYQPTSICKRSQMYTSQDFKPSAMCKRDQMYASQNFPPSTMCKRAQMYASQDFQRSEMYKRSQMYASQDFKPSSMCKRAQMYASQDFKQSAISRRAQIYASQDFKQSAICKNSMVPHRSASLSPPGVNTHPLKAGKQNSNECKGYEEMNF